MQKAAVGSSTEPTTTGPETPGRAVKGAVGGRLTARGKGSFPGLRVYLFPGKEESEGL